MSLSYIKHMLKHSLTFKDIQQIKNTLTSNFEGSCTINECLKTLDFSISGDTIILHQLHTTYNLQSYTVISCLPVMQHNGSLFISKFHNAMGLNLNNKIILDDNISITRVSLPGVLRQVLKEDFITDNIILTRNDQIIEIYCTNHTTFKIGLNL